MQLLNKFLTVARNQTISKFKIGVILTNSLYSLQEFKVLPALEVSRHFTAWLVLQNPPHGSLRLPVALKKVKWVGVGKYFAGMDLGAAKITIIIAILPCKSAINYLYNEVNTLSGFGEAIQYCQLQWYYKECWWSSVLT